MEGSPRQGGRRSKALKKVLDVIDLVFIYDFIRFIHLLWFSRKSEVEKLVRPIETKNIPGREVTKGCTLANTTWRLKHDLLAVWQSFAQKLWQKLGDTRWILFLLPRAPPRYSSCKGDQSQNRCWTGCFVFFLRGWGAVLARIVVGMFWILVVGWRWNDFFQG